MFFEQISSEYANVISSFAIPMVIAIFALAFPLLFQTASRIDDKYDSTLLIKVFRKDRICKWFIYTLLGALICSGLWILQLPRLIDCGEFINILIDNSALILLLVSTFVLVVMTICSMWLMYVYYMPDKLLERLIEQYHSAQTKDKKIYFEAISKILFYSIKKEGEPLARQLQLFYCKEFISCREDKENKIIEYPDFFYDVVFDANECLCQRERKSISWYHDSFYDFFIDEFQHTVISDKTFSFIWKCLRQSVFYQKDEFIFSYWRKAHQYMNFWLEPVYLKYDKNYNTTNQSDVDRRNVERDRFLEFHYALGGLLMMKQKYALINQLTSWTNQTPPKYVLVPETMEEVIKRFMDIEKKDGYITVYYEQKYPFPDISGVNANIIIKMWIKRYIAILFLRQYTLHEYFVYSRTLEMPNPPQTLPEKRKWIEELDILKRFVLEYLSDTSCLKSLNLEELSSPDWFAKNNKPNPEELIENLKNKVEYSAEQKKANQKLDPEKIKQLNDATKKILTNCFDNYSLLFTNKITDTEPHKSLLYGGRYEISDKMAFAEDQDMGYANFDSIYAEIIATEFRHNMPSIFRVYYKTTHYLIAEKDIFPAIDKLQLDNQQFTIVSVGVNLYSYKPIGLTTKENGSWEYNGIPILELGYTQIDAVNNSLFIMRNEDLPCILHNEINKETINKYDLKPIDNNKYHIYTNVVDLHKNTELQKEIKEKMNIQDLDKSVLVCVDVNTEVRCKMDAKCVQLKMFSQFDNIGNPNVPEDVKNIWFE